MAAFPISIPGASSRMDVMSPNSMASPLSISSPYSANSSLSGISNAQTLASSFATSVNSSSTVASAVSPSESESAGGLENGGGNTKKHKPHECEVCGACFARKVHLQRHSLRHQVCKPYCCERCGKCFSRQDSLVRHHRLLHEKIKEKPKRSTGVTKKKSNKAGFCTRCNNLGVKCDGQQPCSRCSTSDYNAQQCSYSIKSTKKQRAASSSGVVVGGRRQSISQTTVASTSSSFGDEDEDMMSISEETTSALSNFGIGHGPRRNTVGHMESTSTFTNDDFQASFPRSFDDASTVTNSWNPHLYQSHPFEMPQLEHSFMDIKSLHPEQLHQHMASTSIDVQPSPSTFFDAQAYSSQPQHQQQQQQQHHHHHQQPQSSHSDQEIPLLSLFPPTSSSHESSSTPSVPIFDWTSVLQGGDSSIMEENHSGLEGGREALPFSKAASDQSLNVTLSRGPEGQDNSCFPSPSIQGFHKLFPTEQQQQAGAVVASMTASNSQILNVANGTVNLASLGLPVPSNFNISVPADLQMSAENWDNLMRCLTSMATRQSGEPIPNSTN